MKKVPNTKKLEAYAKRVFRTKRLRKKQIAVLEKQYIKLCKKYKIMSMSLTITGPISKKEELGCRIAILRQSVDTMNRFDDIPLYNPCTDKLEFTDKD